MSQPSQRRTLSSVLTNSTRDVISSSPGEISSQSTCEYVANRTLNRFPQTSDRSSLRIRNSKIRSPKSRRKSCTPCALAKCKCDLQQPCSCCIAKQKPCTFTDTQSVAAVKVILADVPETECIDTPSASSDVIFSPDALIPSSLKPCEVEKHMDVHYPFDVSPNMCLAAPPDLVIADQNWLNDTGKFVDKFSSPCLQDIFFDWNAPPGCSPLDFMPTLSPIYAPAETTPLGLISDPTHILIHSADLEPENAHQSAGELKRYCTFIIYRLPSPLTTRSQSKLL